MNVFAAMLARVQTAVGDMTAEGLVPGGAGTARVTVEPARDPAFGDMTTNAALILARPADQQRHALADAIAAELRADALVARADVAGPGFINIALRPEAWRRVLRSALDEPQAYGRGRRASAAALTAAAREINALPEFAHPLNKAECDAVRLSVLLRPPGSGAGIDPQKAVEQSYDNPAFSVRYAHARAHAMYGRARDVIPDLPDATRARAALLRGASLERLDDDGELALLRLIAQYPYWQETAAAVRDPHRLAMYLQRLAGAFHAQLRHGIVTPHLRFIRNDDRELTVARLAVVEAVVIILGAGLSQLGFEAPDEIT